jgi:hypothetical protein
MPAVLLAAVFTSAFLGAQTPDDPAKPPTGGSREAARSADPAKVPAAAPLAEDRAAGAAAIAEEDLRAWLGTLASPEFGGRGTGQEGFQKAADFVGARFKELGLEPRGDDGTFFQKVPWGGAKVDDKATGATFFGTQKVVIPAAAMSGQVSVGMSARGRAVLLVVAPIATERGAPTPPVPGLAEADLAGKVVLVHVQGDARQNVATRYAVRSQLQGKAAAAVLFAETAAAEGGLRGTSGVGRGGANRALQGASRMPAMISFGGEHLADLLRAAGKAPADLTGTPGLIDLGAEMAVEIAVANEALPACNVVAVLPGSDPKLRSEFIVVGSHLDHLGRRGDTYFPGADDDGSGTTGVLAVATMLAKNRVQPRRSVLFVCFCGEESGLVGSQFFVQNCPIPLGSIAAELQMDMIGRNEENQRRGEQAADNVNSLHLVGTEKLSRDLHALCLARNERAGFALEWDEEDVFTRSDHAKFAEKGIPIVFFFTGFHRDYHRPTDTPDKIDYAKLQRIATYVYDVAFELATRSERPLVDADLWKKNRGELGGPEHPAAPVRQSPEGQSPDGKPPAGKPPAGKPNGK